MFDVSISALGTHEKFLGVVLQKQEWCGAGLEWNGRAYDGEGGRGWCIAEQASCMAAAVHVEAARQRGLMAAVVSQLHEKVAQPKSNKSIEQFAKNFLDWRKRAAAAGPLTGGPQMQQMPN